MLVLVEVAFTEELEAVRTSERFLHYPSAYTADGQVLATSPFFSGFYNLC